MKISLFPTHCLNGVRRIFESITLVEVMVVIAILGLVAAVAIPIVAQSQHRAQFPVGSVVYIHQLNVKGVVESYNGCSCETKVLFKNDKGELQEMTVDTKLLSKD